MKYGARNQIVGTVKAVKKGDVMSQVTVEVTGPVTMASVLTSDSAADLGIAVGDKVKLVVKAIHVLVVKE